MKKLTVAALALTTAVAASSVLASSSPNQMDPNFDNTTDFTIHVDTYGYDAQGVADKDPCSGGYDLGTTHRTAA